MAVFDIIYWFLILQKGAQQHGLYLRYKSYLCHPVQSWWCWFTLLYCACFQLRSWFSPLAVTGASKPRDRFYFNFHVTGEGGEMNESNDVAVGN
jgi:hypothetical protein